MHVILVVKPAQHICDYFGGGKKKSCYNIKVYLLIAAGPKSLFTNNEHMVKFTVNKNLQAELAIYILIMGTRGQNENMHIFQSNLVQNYFFLSLKKMVYFYFYFSGHLKRRLRVLENGIHYFNFEGLLLCGSCNPHPSLH